MICCFCKLGVLFVGVLVLRPLLLGSTLRPMIFGDSHLYQVLPLENFLHAALQLRPLQAFNLMRLCPASKTALQGRRLSGSFPRLGAWKMIQTPGSHKPRLLESPLSWALKPGCSILSFICFLGGSPRDSPEVLPKQRGGHDSCDQVEQGNSQHQDCHDEVEEQEPWNRTSVFLSWL